MSEPTTVSEVQWGLRFGDGEVWDGYHREADATSTMREIRKDIRAGHYDPDDYEPMTVVRRTETTVWTDWESTR